MKLFSSYKESLGTRFTNQNLEFTRAIIFVFITCMLFGVPHQIATAQTVHIPDPALRAFLELALGKKAGADITQADMASLKYLQASKCRFLGLSETGLRAPNRWICRSTDDLVGHPIQDMTGLEFAINLIELHLGNSRISDVTPLKNLTKLKYLDLSLNRRISDVTAAQRFDELDTSLSQR